MVNPLFEDTLDYWSSRDYWSVEDILNIYWGGLEHVTPDEHGVVKETEDKITNDLLTGVLKHKKCNGRAFILRSDAILWAQNNLKDFPFSKEDFQKSQRQYTKQEETLLNIIGAMALLLAKADPNLYSFETGGVKAKGIHEELSNLQNVEGKTGLKSSNVREIIGTGVNFFNN